MFIYKCLRVALLYFLVICLPVNTVSTVTSHIDKLQVFGTTNIDPSEYPTLPEYCSHVEWATSNSTNNWGNCVNITTDDTFRYIISNTVPDYYVAPICPYGIGYGY